jgi:GNAT superfamily N-acetyltransferase
VKKSIEHSLNFGVYKEGKQVGFSRVITDYATYAYIGDVFILEDYRGQGLSKWLMQVITDILNSRACADGHCLPGMRMNCTGRLDLLSRKILNVTWKKLIQISTKMEIFDPVRCFQSYYG